MKGVILDRDGTLIDVVRDGETGTISVAFHPSHIHFLSHAVEGLRALRDAGYAIAIATNQPGPAKGQVAASAVTRTNEALVARLAAEGIEIRALEVCMHHPTGGDGGDPALIRPCECRKPGSLMLTRAAAALGVQIADCWMIGDHCSDVEAAHAAGARAALIFDQRRCELCPLRTGPSCKPEVVGANLLSVASAILAA